MRIGECSKSNTNATARASDDPCWISASVGKVAILKKEETGGPVYVSLCTINGIPLGYHIHRKHRYIFHSCPYHNNAIASMITDTFILGLTCQSKHVRQSSINHRKLNLQARLC